MSVLPMSQNKRRALYRNAMLAAMAMLVACAIISRATDFAMHIPTAIVVGAIGVLSLLQFNALDEMAKQGQYVAWYWGGLLGLTVMAVLTIAIAVSPETFAFIESLMRGWAGDADTQTAFLLGLVISPSLMMLGFLGWWAVYWLRRR